MIARAKHKQINLVGLWTATAAALIAAAAVAQEAAPGPNERIERSTGCWLPVRAFWWRRRQAS